MDNPFAAEPPAGPYESPWAAAGTHARSGVAGQGFLEGTPADVVTPMAGAYGDGGDDIIAANARKLVVGEAGGDPNSEAAAYHAQLQRIAEEARRQSQAARVVEARLEDMEARFNVFDTGNPNAPKIVDECTGGLVAADDAQLERFSLQPPVQALLARSDPLIFQADGRLCFPRDLYHEALRDTPLGDASFEEFLNTVEVTFQALLMRHRGLYTQVEKMGRALDLRVMRESGVRVAGTQDAGPKLRLAEDTTRYRGFV